MKIKLFAILLFAGLLSSGVYAQVPGSIDLNPPLSSFLYYTYTATNGLVYSEYVSPYPATITYGSQTNVQAYLTCLDVNNPTSVGATYTGTWQTNTAAYTTAFKEASWLTDKLYGLTPQNVTNLNAIGPISLAIWYVMLPSSTQPTPAININAEALTLVNQASNAVANGYVADIIYFSPSNSASQRFMLNPPSTLAVPEPSQVAASLLLVSGIAGYVFFNRKKKLIA